jgi:hypothetical protein
MRLLPAQERGQSDTSQSAAAAPEEVPAADRRMGGTMPVKGGVIHGSVNKVEFVQVEQDAANIGQTVLFGVGGNFRQFLR